MCRGPLRREDEGDPRDEARDRAGRPARARAVQTFVGSSTWSMVPGFGSAQFTAGEVTRYSRQLIGRSAWMEQLSSSRNGHGMPRWKYARPNGAPRLPRSPPGPRASREAPPRQGARGPARSGRGSPSAAAREARPRAGRCGAPRPRRSGRAGGSTRRSPFRHETAPPLGVGPLLGEADEAVRDLLKNGQERLQPRGRRREASAPSRRRRPRPSFRRGSSPGPWKPISPSERVAPPSAGINRNLPAGPAADRA